MSTRSRIAITQPDGSFLSIYCHFDGYDSGNGVGPTLRKYYADYPAAEKLIRLGDLSSLDGATPVSYHHKFKQSWKLCAPKRHLSHAGLLKDSTKSDANYLYLHDGQQWHTMRLPC